MEKIDVFMSRSITGNKSELYIGVNGNKGLLYFILFALL